jgi:hypothetical protein
MVPGSHCVLFDSFTLGGALGYDSPLKDNFAEPQKSRAGANSPTLRRGGNWPGAWLRGELAAGFT